MATKWLPDRLIPQAQDLRKGSALNPKEFRV